MGKTSKLKAGWRAGCAVVIEPVPLPVAPD